MQRDVRVDFLRGFVLLLIVADHVLNNDRAWFAFGDWIICDGAEAFVFLSGLVCGMVYFKKLVREGLWATQRKAVRRAGQLYVAQMLTLTAAVVALVLFSEFDPIDAGPFGLSSLLEHPVEGIANVLALQYTPWLMDILKLYIVLLLALPFMLWVFQRSRALAVGLSGAVYLAAQIWPELSPHEYPHGLPWFWNPFGWQFLFFFGVWCGAERLAGRLKLPRSPWLIATAIVGLSAIIALYRSGLLGYQLVERQRLGPAHIASFLVIAYLLSISLRAEWRIWSAPVVRAIVACGRRSLFVFCFGVVADYVVSMALVPLHGDSTAQAALVGIGVLLTLCAGVSADWWFRRAARTARATRLPAVDFATQVVSNQRDGELAAAPGA